jgi:hypothetical protein
VLIARFSKGFCGCQFVDCFTAAGKDVDDAIAQANDHFIRIQIYANMLAGSRSAIGTYSQL